MENIDIVISKKTRMIDKISKTIIGNDGENLQENLVFSFSDEFVNGQARLELIMPDKSKSFIVLTKEEETYQIPVLSVLTRTGKIKMQLVITEGVNEQEIPIFKSNIFYLIVNNSINFIGEPPEEYNDWLEIANTKLNQMDNFDIVVSKEGSVATLTITDREGTETSVEILDGQQGEQGIQGVPGQDATINGVNTINIEAGENISLDQQENTLTINSIGGGKVTSVNGEIGDVVLTTNDLTNDSGFITNAVNDLVNYYLKNETYTKAEVNTLIGNIQQFHYEVVQELPATGENNILYLVPKATSQTNNYYDEYVYSNGWEKIGDTEIDLSDYVKNTDYPTENKGGVIRINSTYGYYITTGGSIYAMDYTYQQYGAKGRTSFISKGTLENVITGKELVSSSDLTDYVQKTDYAGLNTAGILKATNGLSVATNGVSYAQTYTSTQYDSMSNGTFVGKGTLENVITSKGLIDSSKVKTTTSTTSGDVYDVTYINGLIGDINTILATLTTPSNGGGE